jgi:sialic acid synthase SpsE
VAGRSALLEVGGRQLGPGRPCLVVAEAGSAHRGELARGLELVEAAVEAGAGAVKFQIIFADEIVHPRTGAILLPAGEVPIYERFRSLERGEDFYARLKEATERRGALFLASVFGPRSLRILKNLGAAAVKIASPELNHFPLLELVSASGLPVILSTGVSTLGDIEQALARCPGAALLHCLTAYPAPEGEYNLRLLPTLGAVFGVPVGVSDHSLDPILVPGAASALGACLVEKHLTLARTAGGLDDPIALEPGTFAAMTRELRELEGLGREQALARLRERCGRQRVEQALGDGVKRLAPAERGFYAATRRSLHASSDIRAGQILGAADICIVRSERNLRPGLGPEHLETVTGCVAARSIPAGEGILWEDLLTRGR